MKHIRRNFGVLNNLVESMMGKISSQVVNRPPQRPLEGYNSLEASVKTPVQNATTFSNGVQVFTESASFPSHVHMGVLVNAGTRDETSYNSGVNFALKNVFLKTNERTNEQLNYCMIQMSGGQWTCEHSQEHIVYKGNFLAHDTYDFIQMLSDMLFDDKTLIDEECSLWRVDEYWKLKELNSCNQAKLNDLWLTLAYGPKGLGMPLNGYQSKFQNVGMRAMNEFRRQHVTPGRIIVMASGINNHDEFVEAVRPYFEVVGARSAPEREKSKYIGGEWKEMDEGDSTAVHISFQGVSQSHELATASHVLKALVGNSCKNSGCASTRSQSHLVQKYPYVNSVQTLIKTFTDSGNFGLNVVGNASQAQDLVQAAAKEFSDLVNVSDQEVRRAKNLLKLEILNLFERAEDRLERVAKHYVRHGKDLDLLGKIDAVTTDQVKQFVANMFKSPITYAVVGGDTHGVPSADKLTSQYFK